MLIFPSSQIHKRILPLGDSFSISLLSLDDNTSNDKSDERHPPPHPLHLLVDRKEAAPVRRMGPDRRATEGREEMGRTVLRARCG
jgi:hypothetical protein